MAWTPADDPDCLSPTSHTSGHLIDNVVINSRADADKVVILSGTTYTSEKGCGDISSYSFVDCGGPVCPDVTIAVYGGTWNDHILVQQGEFAEPVGYPVLFSGGSGHDCINDQGTSAGNLLYGNEGDDYVVHEGEHWDTDIYGDSPCSPPYYCGPSGADCVRALEDFNLMDCGGQTDKYFGGGSGTVSNCEEDTTCSCTSPRLINVGIE